jgi:hypothetical protein
MLMTNQQSAELTKPCIGSLHNPAANITPQFASIFVPSLLVVRPVGRNQFDAAFLEPPSQRIRIVSAVSDYSLGFLSRPAFPTRHADSASVASASVTSLGEALSSRTPSGRP